MYPFLDICFHYLLDLQLGTLTHKMVLGIQYCAVKIYATNPPLQLAKVMVPLSDAGIGIP
jgi:hypothetical protein